MPWKDADGMNLRTEFVLRAFRDVEPFGELCLGEIDLSTRKFEAIRPK